MGQPMPLSERVAHALVVDNAKWDDGSVMAMIATTDTPANRVDTTVMRVRVSHAATRARAHAGPATPSSFSLSTGGISATQLHLPAAVFHVFEGDGPPAYNVTWSAVVARADAYDISTHHVFKVDQGGNATRMMTIPRYVTDTRTREETVKMLQLPHGTVDLGETTPRLYTFGELHDSVARGTPAPTIYCMPISATVTFVTYGVDVPILKYATMEFASMPGDDKMHIVSLETHEAMNTPPYTGFVRTNGLVAQPDPDRPGLGSVEVYEFLYRLKRMLTPNDGSLPHLTAIVSRTPPDYAGPSQLGMYMWIYAPDDKLRDDLNLFSKRLDQAQMTIAI
jgi:hypothetical protein